MSMQKVLLNVFVVVLICCTFTFFQNCRADDAPTQGFTSEAEFLEACRIAIGDLSRKRTEGFVDLIDRGAPQGASTAQMESGFIANIKKLAAESEKMGDPLDYEYIGVKEAGAYWRQYTFIVRHEHMLVKWTLIGYEMDGRWFLTNYAMTVDIATFIADALPVDLKKDECAQQFEDIIELISQGNRKGFELFEAQCLPLLDNVDQLKLRYFQLYPALGKLIDHQLIRTTALGDSFRHYQYLIHMEKGPILIRLSAFRTPEGWRIAAFTFNANQPDMMFDEMPLEPVE